MKPLDQPHGQCSLDPISLTGLALGALAGGGTALASGALGGGGGAQTPAAPAAPAATLAQPVNQPTGQKPTPKSQAPSFLGAPLRLSQHSLGPRPFSGNKWSALHRSGGHLSANRSLQQRSHPRRFIPGPGPAQRCFRPDGRRDDARRGQVRSTTPNRNAQWPKQQPSHSQQLIGRPTPTFGR